MDMDVDEYSPVEVSSIDDARSSEKATDYPGPGR